MWCQEKRDAELWTAVLGLLALISKAWQLLSLASPVYKGKVDTMHVFSLMNPLNRTWMDNIDSIIYKVSPVLYTTWITSAMHCHQSTCVSVAGSLDLWVWSRQISRVHLSTVITKFASNLRRNKTSSPKFAHAHLLNVQQGCMCFKFQMTKWLVQGGVSR